ncbi:MAG TPA: hypothetical protein VHU40_04345 [Polyangia bacterium]|nr:hypothetical protein [Polyangia bacterium]
MRMPCAWRWVTMAALVAVGWATGVARAADEAGDPEATPVEPLALPASPPAPPPVLEPPRPVVPEPAPALDLAGDEAAPSVEVHGFASQGYILTTGNDYIAPDTKHGSFHFTDVGLNLSKNLSEKIRFGVQAFAQNFAPGGNFNLQADWFYLDYRWRDWLGVRFGRLKIPFGLYNEINDVDSARVPVLLPQSTYPIQGRSFLFAQTGVELYGFARSRAAGALEYRLYLGAIFIDPAILVPPGSEVQLKLNVRYVGGGRLFWETPLEGLRLGVSVLSIHLDVDALAQGMTFPIANQSLLSMASAEYVAHRLVLTAEYALWHAHQDSVLPSSAFTGTSERSYAMLSYRVAPWFQPALYYALYFRDVHDRGGNSTTRQNDGALTLRFDATENLIFKIEGHLMEGTAGLTAPLSISEPPVDPERVWGVFLLKATGYF